jgi:hypothetical protein
MISAELTSISTLSPGGLAADAARLRNLLRLCRLGPKPDPMEITRLDHRLSLRELLQRRAAQSAVNRQQCMQGALGSEARRPHGP